MGSTKIKKEMPTRIVDGYRIVKSGVFYGDDEIAGAATTMIISAPAAAAVHMEPSHPEGPLVVKYDLNAGQKGFTVETKQGADLFYVSESGNTVVNRDLVAREALFQLQGGDALFSIEDSDSNPLFRANPTNVQFDVDTLFAEPVSFDENVVFRDKTLFQDEIETYDLIMNGVVGGSATDKVDNHQTSAGKDTLVLRDSHMGATYLSNLRVFSRELPGTDYLDGVGLAPDGLLPGLFATRASFSDEVRLVENAHIVASLPSRFYRFGYSPGGRDINNDGLHFSSTFWCRGESRLARRWYKNVSEGCRHGSRPRACRNRV